MPRTIFVAGLLGVLAGHVLIGQAPADFRAGLEAMAAAERAFAKAALEKGIRDAFVEFFADDSFGYYPTPMNAREFYRKQAPTPLSRRLEWEPRLGDIARSGELGWLTGPFSSRNTENNNPPAYGCYFSIWKKQQDGSWKVLMDIGAGTPGPAEFPNPAFSAVAEPKGRYTSGSNEAAAANDVILRFDRDLAGAIERKGAPAAYEAVLTSVSRLHVPGHQPVVGSEAISARLREAPGALSFVPDGGEVARSADLAFTRGSYEIRSTGAADQPVEKGYYVRTWKRAADGQWTLGAEVRNPIPEKAKD